MNELDQAKRDWDRAQDSLRNILLDLTPFVNEKRHPLRETREWQDLYYAQPHSSQAAVSLERKFLLLAERDPSMARAVQPVLDAAIAAANRVCELRAAPKQTRKPTTIARYGAAYRGSWEAQPVAPEAINPGDYLVLRYGKGHQLAYVVSPTSDVGLKILRLCSRGYTYAGWQESWISRFDPRIEGLGRPVFSDPKLPV